MIVVGGLAIVCPLAGCKKATSAGAQAEKRRTTSHDTRPVTPTRSVDDACTLITKEEVEAIQGAAVKDIKSSRNEGSYRSSQCFYTTDDFSKSVSLALTQSDPTKHGDAREYWQRTFGRYDDADADRPRDGEEKQAAEEPKSSRDRDGEERKTPPRKISGSGEEAFWEATRVGGVLFVLKGDSYLRVSLGGRDDDETRLKKAQALAQKALDRF